MSSLRKKSAKPSRQREQKTPRRGTPIRNGALLVVFAAVLAALVIALPKEPTRPAAALLTAGEISGDGTASDLPLRISEVMPSNQDAYPDDKGNYSDWVEIENTGDAAVNLSGIGLSDRNDRILFLFPDMELEAGGYLVVFCDDTNAAAAGQALHARFKISALGETLYLFGNSAIVLDSVEVPAMNSDTSYALTAGGWMITDRYTPGYPNTEEGYAALRGTALTSADGLVINELCASNRATLVDEDGEYADWIELYNGGALTIDLYNYVLSDNESNLTKWRFPQGAKIAPGEYYVVFASGKDRPGGDGTLPHTNFKLAAEGETVILSDILRQAADRTTYENLARDTSWGRVDGMDGVWAVFQQPTPGMPNNQQGAMEMDRRIRARNGGGVFISEVVTSSTGIDIAPYGVTSYDWIELVNLSGQPVNLNGWGLSDNVGRPRKWQFGDVTIQPGEYLLVFPSGETTSPSGSDAIHAAFRLSALGETVTLSDSRGTILDKLVVPKLERDNSYGRDFDQGGLFYYETPTPGASNTTTGFAGYTATPKISLKGGMYAKAVTVEITAPEGVRIRYTLDGSNPTETVGYDYAGPLEIGARTPLRVRGFSEGLKASEIATETYLINTYHSLPVIAVTLDPDELDNPETGMFAVDLEKWEAETRAGFKDQPYWQKLPHAGNFEYFTAEGEQMLNQGVEFQLNGQYSLDQAQKSIRVTARQRYGESTLAYPFFSDRPYTEYQSVILRNGGQDGKYTRIIDALQANIIGWTDSTVMTMASQPVIVFINGEYYGHYNLRERINKHSIAAYEGWADPEQIDFIKGDNNVISGSMTNYNQLIQFVREHDLNDPEALQTVLDWVDVDNYFDFMIFQIYFGNTDAGNIKFYRLRAPGEKWRWIIYDLDWGYFQHGTNSPRVWLKDEGAGANSGTLFTNVLIRKLLAVPEMRDKFLTRFGFLYQEYLSDTDRIMELAESMLATIEPELGLHFSRWAGLEHALIAESTPTAEALRDYWVAQTNRMRNVLKVRPHRLWGFMQDWFELSDAVMEGYFGPQPAVPEDAIYP